MLRSLIGSLIAVLSLFLSARAYAACPSNEGIQQTLEYQGSALYSTISLSVDAGGAQNIEGCFDVENGPAPIGYTSTYSSFLVGYTSDEVYDLEFRVRSQCDAILVVNTFDNRWLFDDDSSGELDPRIRITDAPEGKYDIWVGTKDGGACSAILKIETLDPKE